MRTLARHRLTVLIVVAALLAIGGAAWLGRDQRTYGGTLDPRNPDGDGAQALARVLDQQGVGVDVVRSADAFDDTTIDDSTAVVVTSAGYLGRSTTQRLLTHRGSATLVVVAPTTELVRQLGLSSYGGSAELPGPLPAGCSAYDGLSLDVTSADAYRLPGCFTADHHRTVLARPSAGLVLLGAPDALTNDQILSGDNAAIALRLLGQERRLVWYVPSLADLAGGDGVSVAGLLPRWLGPALWLTGAALVALVVWRARRLGPLAREPLPVEVKAIETTRNLGRLYRTSGDRAHAADALRRSSRTRLARRLRLPSGAEPDQVVRAVAGHTGREEADIGSLLAADAVPPRGDAELVELATALAALDRSVTDSVAGAADPTSPTGPATGR